MTTAKPDDVAVGPILWRHIGPYKRTRALNIVENPAVGLLVVPSDVGALLDQVVRTWLRSCERLGEDAPVRVVCIRTTPSRLMLEVSANHSWTSLFMQRHQVRLGYRVRALGGRFAWGTRKDGTKFTRLYVPVAP